jgi:hypothetical protein
MSWYDELEYYLTEKPEAQQLRERTVRCTECGDFYRYDTTYRTGIPTLLKERDSDWTKTGFICDTCLMELANQEI